jgi:D-alanyl-D-alanine carboxypeptidase
MRKRLIILLVSLVLSLPFWWGINILAKGVESFYSWQEIAGNPEILAAEANQQFLNKQLKELKEKRRRAENFRNLKINAKEAIAAEINSKGNEEILFRRNFERPLPIASITKLMTSLVVFKLKGTYNLSQIITISKEAVEQEGDSKWGGWEGGGKMALKNLLHMALI